MATIRTERFRGNGYELIYSLAAADRPQLGAANRHSTPPNPGITRPLKLRPIYRSRRYSLTLLTPWKADRTQAHPHPSFAGMERKHLSHHMGQQAGPSTPPASEVTLATLLPIPLACCRWELEQRHMMPPSDFALRIIVEQDAKLVRTLNTNYGGAAADGGLEPVEKDALLDILARHFTGQPWTCSGGMDATRRFMADLQNAMIATRWNADLLATA
jgi:hypothetical protein